MGRRRRVPGSAGRYWSVVTVPILDSTGRPVLLLHRPEDVTRYVLDGLRGPDGAAPLRADRPPVAETVAAVDARTRELRAGWEADGAARRRAAALSEVALQLSRAQTVEDLTTVVIGQGLAALGADAGAVAVRNGDHLELAIASSLGDRTKAEYGTLPLDGPLPACVAAATGRTVVLADRDASLAWAPAMREMMATTGCAAWVALPLHGDRTTLGSLTVGWAKAQEFPSAELDVLVALAAQCGYGLERIRTREAERSTAAQTRRMSETLQRSLLTEPFQPDHLQLAVRYVPAAHDAQVGGDWYDAFLAPDGALCLVIGDVAGHDRKAVAAMGQLRNLLRGIAYTLDEPPSGILSALDGAMRQLEVGSLATGVFGKVEQTRLDSVRGVRRFRWSNAGHPPPLLIEPDGTARLLLTPPDLLLGTGHGTARVDHRDTLRPGSTLLLYTDGLVERRNADLDAGLAWLVHTAARYAGGTLDALCDGLLAEIGPDPADDVALLAIRAHPEDEPDPEDPAQD